MPTQFFTARRRGAWHVCSAFKIQLQGLYYSGRHYPHETHFSNFIGIMSNGGYSLSWLHLPTKSYTPVLNVFIPTFLLAHSNPSAYLYVPRTNLHFGSRSFHIAASTVWNYLPSTLRSSQTLNTFRKHLKTIFSRLLLIEASDLSSASDSFYWMIMALNKIWLLTYLTDEFLPL